MIDIKNIKSITVVKSNSMISIPDKINELNDEKTKRRSLYPKLTSMYKDK